MLRLVMLAKLASVLTETARLCRRGSGMVGSRHFGKNHSIG